MDESCYAPIYIMQAQPIVDLITALGSYAAGALSAGLVGVVAAILGRF